jgi:hypothetical protein
VIRAAFEVELSSWFLCMELDTEKFKENQETLMGRYLASRNRFLYYSKEITAYENDKDILAQTAAC